VAWVLVSPFCQVENFRLPEAAPKAAPKPAASSASVKPDDKEGNFGEMRIGVEVRFAGL